MIHKPFFFRSTRWNSNEFVRGAYSYVSTDCDQDDIKPKHLAQFIHFEHLNDFKTNSVDDISAKLKTLDLSSSQNILNQIPAIIFAGECCHDEYYSTAHGAFHSGLEQAEKLLKFYEK